MSVNKMHIDEIDISTHLVRRLLKNQFPKWSDLNLEIIKPEGTDNAMYKLGDDKVVRLPRIESAAANIKKESLWVPKLASNLPISIPTILGKGERDACYPLPWLICEWLEGKNPIEEGVLNQHQAAINLGNFVSAMQKIDTDNAPYCKRGQSLNMQDKETHDSIPLLKDIYDTDFLTRIWKSVVRTPSWTGSPVWIHGDLHPGNLLVDEGFITAVVDFGMSGVGDPAADLMVAWTLLNAQSRETFRAYVKPDDATWARAQGWALNLGILGYPYYKISNPIFAGIAKRAIDEVLIDYKITSGC